MRAVNLAWIKRVHDNTVSNQRYIFVSFVLKKNKIKITYQKKKKIENYRYCFSRKNNISSPIDTRTWRWDKSGYRRREENCNWYTRVARWPTAWTIYSPIATRDPARQAHVWTTITTTRYPWNCSRWTGWRRIRRGSPRICPGSPPCPTYVIDVPT